MGDQRLDNDESGDWLSLVDASSRLGTSVDALRSRARRGMLTTRRGNDGRLQVRVLAGQSTVTDQSPDRSRLGGDGIDDEALAELLFDMIRHRLWNLTDPRAHISEIAIAVPPEPKAPGAAALVVDPAAVNDLVLQELMAVPKAA
mgnify:CR=1 FL=1